MPKGAARFVQVSSKFQTHEYTFFTETLAAAARSAAAEILSFWDVEAGV
jgi:hypothetical protein